MACSLVLHFGGGAKGAGANGEGVPADDAGTEGHQCQLISSVFTPASNAPALSCVRGKSAGAFQGYGSFQWTKAVQGVAALAVKTVLSFHSEQYSPFLQGERGSHAAALDFAMSKQPVWLLDMFGVQIDGRPLAQSLFRRTNTNLKRPGPVVIAINQRYLPAQSIQLWWNQKLLTDVSQLVQLAQAIEVTS
jgi:hypothetical protein